MKSWLFLLLLAAIFVFPLIVLGLYAVAPGWSFPELLPSAFDLRAFHYLWGQKGRLLVSLLSSVGYSFLTVALTFLMCIVPARHFARYEFSGKRLLEGLLLAPALVPSMTFSMGVHYMFIRLGLTDSVAGIVLVLATFSYPYMLRALVAGYQAFGSEYEMCAVNLGAGRFTRLVRVELPLLLPSVIAGGSVVFLVAFSEYFLVFLIGGGAVPSYTGYLFPFLNSSDRSTASLLALIFLVVPVGLFLLIEIFVSRAYRKRGMY